MLPVDPNAGAYARKLELHSLRALKQILTVQNRLPSGNLAGRKLTATDHANHLQIDSLTKPALCFK